MGGFVTEEAVEAFKTLNIKAKSISGLTTALENYNKNTTKNKKNKNFVPVKMPNYPVSPQILPPHLACMHSYAFPRACMNACPFVLVRGYLSSKLCMIMFVHR